MTLSQSCGRTPGQQNEEKKGVHPCPERTLRQSNESASIMAGLGGPTVGHSAPRLPTDNTPGRFFILSAFRLLGVGLALGPQRCSEKAGCTSSPLFLFLGGGPRGGRLLSRASANIVEAAHWEPGEERFWWNTVGASITSCPKDIGSFAPALQSPEVGQSSRYFLRPSKLIVTSFNAGNRRAYFPFIAPNEDSPFFSQ